MAGDMFLKIHGIKGESTDSKHRGEIEVLSFSWGETQTGSAGRGGGAGAGKVSVQDFHFVARTGAQSPPLMLACANGKHFSKAELTVRKAGEDQQEFFKVSIENLLISSYQVGASDSGETVPVDQVSLNFSKIHMSVLPAVQSEDGSLGARVEAGF